MRERPGQKIKLKTIDEMLGVVGEESAMEIEIEKIHPFRNHPFHVVDDAKMQDLIDSIRENGILSPTLIRPIGNDEYEMVSGHRRMHAAMKLGMETIPAIIRDMTDDEAIVKMVDSNIQREELLPSEKAFAYKMKMDAMKRQGSRSDTVAGGTSTQNGWKLETAELIGRESGESKNQIRRYIRLTELIPDLLDFVDRKRLQFTVAVEISYIDKEIQGWLYAVLLDRMSLSVKNHWMDDQNRVYIIYQVEEIVQDLGFTKRKAMDVLTELEQFGLVSRKRRGRGLPNYLYVKNFLSGLTAFQSTGKGPVRNAHPITSADGRRESRSADIGTSQPPRMSVVSAAAANKQAIRVGTGRQEVQDQAPLDTRIRLQICSRQSSRQIIWYLS